MHPTNWLLVILTDAMMQSYHHLFGLVTPFDFKNLAKYLLVAGSFLLHLIYQLLKACRILMFGWDLLWTPWCIAFMYVVFFFMGSTNETTCLGHLYFLGYSILSTCLDGARNITCRVRKITICISNWMKQRRLLFNSIWTWCTPTRSCGSEVVFVNLNKKIYLTLTATIKYMRRQQILINKMRSKC